ncbi:PepSY domain-containing protein [Oceanobacillus locisalsi]|uniref:PepSY domain-containing protein n=1 Tax=Oceanobacillus locisalsi TaxID=546107 RepID=A0ABW3NLG9_9BACI
MMKNKLLIGAAGATFIFGGAAVASASNDSNAEEKVPAEEALQTAFEKVNGFVQEVDLEFEEDENYYEIDIETSSNAYEFNIDAANGEVVGEETENNTETEEDGQEESEQESSSDGGNYPNKPDHVTSFEEYSTINEQVNAEDLNFHLVTDNPGNRVMFLVDDEGKKHFKTIFVKHDNHLKIVDVNGGGVVYNSVL